MKTFLLILGCAVGLLFIAIAAGNRSDFDRRVTSEPLSKQQKCIGGGITYYKEIGSYPTLSDGGDAHKLIIQKCKSNPNLWS